MQIREIEHDRWRSFFNDFSQLHHGKRVSVESKQVGSLAAKPSLFDQPLIGIVSVCDVPGIAERIEVIAGSSAADSEAAYRVANPRHVWLGEEENGWMIGLQIECADGSITMVRFEPPREGMPRGFNLA